MVKYKVGSIIEVKVTGIANYGFFVEANNGYTGLCHISEMSNDFVEDVHNFVHEEESVFVQILEIDHERKHMKVSIKDIYYKTEEDGNHIVESRKGFLPLKKMLPIWIKDKISEYDNL